MRELHDEHCRRKPDHEDNWHFDTASLTPADFLREEDSSNSEIVGDEAVTLLKAKFDYLRDIMSDASVPGVRRRVERFLKTRISVLR
jgi:hypothetical protein